MSKNLVNMDELKESHPDTIESLEKNNNQLFSKAVMFKSANEITEKLVGTQYLIKPFLEQNVVGFMYGQTGSKKSFLAIDIGLSIATGTKFHGRNSKKSTVFYFCGEGAENIGKRIEAWKIHHGVSDIEDFFVSELPGSFSDENYIDKIIETLKDYSNIDDNFFIIIDTLSTNIGAYADENNNNDIAEFISSLNKIRSIFKCNILTVHHTGHSNTNRERGASAIGSNADFRIFISSTEDGCNMESKKVKDRQSWDPVSFKEKYIEIDYLIDSEGVTEGSLVLEQIDYIPIEGNLNTGSGKNQKLLFKVIEDLAHTQIQNLKEKNLKIPEQIIIELKSIENQFFLNKNNFSSDNVSQASIAKAWQRVLKQYPWKFTPTADGIFYETNVKES